MDGFAWSPNSINPGVEHHRFKNMQLDHRKAEIWNSGIHRSRNPTTVVSKFDNIKDWNRWPNRGGSKRREPPRKNCCRNKKDGNVKWSRNKGSRHGFAPYFVCAKLHTLPMVSTCALAHYALKMPSLRFTFCYLSKTGLLFWEALGAMVPWCQSGAMNSEQSKYRLPEDRWLYIPNSETW